MTQINVSVENLRTISRTAKTLTVALELAPNWVQARQLLHEVDSALTDA